MSSTINASTSSGIVLNSDTSGVLQLQTASTTAVTIDASQNVGVGVTPSAWVGNVAIQVGPVGAVSSSSTGGATLSYNAYSTSAGWAGKYISNGYASIYEQAGGVHYWYNAPSGTAGNTISFTQAMTLDASGNLGIGLTNPSSILHISSANPIFKLTNTSSNDTPYLQAGVSGDGYMYVSGGSGRGVKLAYNAGTVGATLDASGNLLVGTTSTFTPNYKMHVACASGTGGISIRAYNTSTNYPLNFQNSSGTDVGSVSITTTATSYNTSSDYRLKNTITPMTNALAKIAQLKPVTYKWNADGSDGEGFIAHELAEVCSHAVTGEKDAVDSDGNPVYQGIDTSFLVATLTAAIKELSAQVTELKAEVQALKEA